MAQAPSRPVELPKDFRKLDDAAKKAALDNDQAREALKKTRDQARSVRVGVERKIARVLRKKQLENLRKMEGEPFDFGKLSVATLPPASAVANPEAAP